MREARNTLQLEQVLMQEHFEGMGYCSSFIVSIALGTVIVQTVNFKISVSISFFD